MSKSMLATIKDGVRTAAKGSLYVTGGTALAYPLLEGAYEFTHGAPARDALTTVVVLGTGFNPQTNTFNTQQMNAAIVRTGFGAVAIWAAKKL